MVEQWKPGHYNRIYEREACRRRFGTSAGSTCTRMAETLSSCRVTDSGLLELCLKRFWSSVKILHQRWLWLRMSATETAVHVAALRHSWYKRKSVELRQKVESQLATLRSWPSSLTSTSSAIPWKRMTTTVIGWLEDLRREYTWSTWQRACTPQTPASFSFSSAAGPESGYQKLRC